MKIFYKNSKVEVMYNDIVKTIYNDKLYKIESDIYMHMSTVSIVEKDNYHSGFGSYPINELNFITREIEDCEEILP